MYQIAIIWWILSQIGSDKGRALGFFLVAGALPAIFFVKIVGKIVDEYKSKWILVICDLLAFVVIISVYYLLINSKLTLLTASLAGFAVAMVEAFFNPAINKAIPELVDKKDIQSAVTYQSSTQYLASFSGAVAGGLLIDAVGIPGVILINATSYIISALCNLGIKFKLFCLESLQTSSNNGVSGWKILDDAPLIKKILVGFGLVNFFTVPLFIVLPVYTKEAIKGNATLLGLLEAALWMGLLSGTFAAPVFDRIKNTVKIGVFSLLAFGISLVVPGIFINKFVYGLILFTGGFAIGVNNVRFMSFFQHIINPSIKGRFFALLFALTSFTFPISYLCFGFLADYFFPPTLCIIEGCGVLLLSFYFKKLEKQEEEYVSALNKGLSAINTSSELIKQ